MLFITLLSITLGKITSFLIMEIPKETKMNIKNLITLRRPDYSLIELFESVIIILLYLQFGISMDFVKYSLLISILIVIGIIDFKTTYVYSLTTYTGISIGGIFVFYEFMLGNSINNHLIGIVLIFIIIGLMALAGGIGWGDFEIYLMCSLFLELDQLILLLIVSFTLGAIFGIVSVLRKKSLNKHIPFGHYIMLSCILITFLDNYIISIYFTIIK